jgi:hypothetical protein
LGQCTIYSLGQVYPIHCLLAIQAIQVIKAPRLTWATGFIQEHYLLVALILGLAPCSLSQFYLIIWFIPILVA